MAIEKEARWKDLPRGYPSCSTCWRRLQAWQAADVWRSAWRAFLGQLDAQGHLDWHDVFDDGTFAGAKKGALVGKTKRGKGMKLMVVADGQGVLWGVELAPASPHEGTF